MSSVGRLGARTREGSLDLPEEDRPRLIWVVGRGTRWREVEIAQRDVSRLPPFGEVGVEGGAQRFAVGWQQEDAGAFRLAARAAALGTTRDTVVGQRVACRARV